MLSLLLLEGPWFVPLELRETQQNSSAEKKNANSPPATAHAARLHLAMALTRLVNGVADAAQQGRVAKSVARLAASAGLPRSAVDARHEATHGDLPSLAALHRAALACLRWLEAHYWLSQLGMLREKRGRVREALLEYTRLRALAAAACLGGAGAGKEEHGGGGGVGGRGGRGRRHRRRGRAARPQRNQQQQQKERLRGRLGAAQAEAAPRGA